MDLSNLRTQATPLTGFDPTVTKEEMTFTPPPEGNYNIQTEFRPVYGQENAWTPVTFGDETYYKTSCVGHITEPGSEWDKRLVFRNKLTTRMREDGSNAVGDFIKAAGFGDRLLDGSVTTHEQLCTLASEIAEAGKVVPVYVNWAARKGYIQGSSNQYQVDVFGMKNFPTDEKGNPIPEVTGTIDDDPITVKAIPVIVRFLVSKNATKASA